MCYSSSALKASLNYVGGVEERAGVLHKRLESEFEDRLKGAT